MFKARWLVAVAGVVGFATSAFAATDQWRGALVLPKSADVTIEAENGEPVSMYDIAWPATVTRTKGRYLWVQDQGGYSAKRVGGWIYTDDVEKLDSAREHFSESIGNRESAWAYWMRGICWENAGEPAVAIVDYQNALRVEPNTGIDDINIRLGRLIAQEQLLGGRGYYDPSKRDTWESYFTRAQQINSNRPQLYYDWGFALSNACACTQARNARIAKKAALAAAKAKASSKSPASSGNSPSPSGAQKPSGGANASTGKPIVAEDLPAAHAAPKKPLIAARGLDSDDDTQSETPQPAYPSKSRGSHAADQKPAEPIPPANPWPKLDEAALSMPPVGPSTEGAQAAVEALEKYETAESLSPNWWVLPLARAELMLNQCDEESPRGDRVVIGNFKPDFLAQLLDHHKTWKARKGNPAAAPVNMVASRGGDDADDSATGGSLPAPAVSKPPAVNVIATALDDFNRAISLNPNSVDAYRDRAEALRLANRLSEAEQSATTACTMCNFREPRSLRTLAQISNDSGRYQAASDYALRAAELTDGEEQQRFLRLWATYGQRTNGDTKALAVASQNAGYVMSRGIDGDDDSSADGSEPLKHIDPPPGFISLGNNSSPQ